MTSVLINGLGRSGTSWVHKVFDQNPHVLAPFEPESALSRDFKRNLRHASDDAIDTYVDTLFSTRALRAMRKRPIMRKAYHNAWQHQLRVAYMYGASGLGQILPFTNQNNWPVPDLVSRADLDIVVKAVSQQYELGRIIARRKDIKVIYLVRHPCGQILSHLKGMKAGKMTENFLPPREDMDRLFSFDRPAADLTEADFDQVEINAYRWAVYNDVVVRAVADQPHARVFIYENICEDPIAAFKDMFDWAGIPWHLNCAAFLEKSVSTSADSDAYHGLIRNPAIAAHKWRKDMDLADKAKVIEICKASAAAALYDGFKNDA